MRRLCNILVKEGYIEETEEKKVEETGSEVDRKGAFSKPYQKPKGRLRGSLIHPRIQRLN